MKVSISVYGNMVTVNDVSHSVPGLKELMPILPMSMPEITSVQFEDGLGHVEFDRPKHIRITNFDLFKVILQAWGKEHAAHEALLRSAKPADKEDRARIDKMLSDAGVVKSAVNAFLKGA